MEKTQVIIIEAGHLSKTAISGGDKLIGSMIPYLKRSSSFSFTIIIPQIAKKHWQTASRLKFYFLPPFFLEKYPSIPLAVFLIYLWRSYYLLTYLIKLKKKSILYSSSAELADWLAPFFLKILKKEIKWIVRIHHLKSAPKNRPGKYLTNYLSFLAEKIGLLCFKKADIIIALNKNVSEKISEIVAKSKIKTLGAGINFQKINKFKPLLNVSSYDAVFLGRIHYTKGVLDLPIIWDLVRKSLPDAKLALIGELSIPKLAEELKYKIAQAKLQKSVKILGYLPEKDALSILKKTRIFLFTDREAGFGLAAAEAMAAGVPVVGWDIGILGTIFKKGYRKIPLNNYQKFASVIVEILKNANLQRELSRQAQLEAEKFDWRKISVKFNNLLIQVCSKQSLN